MVFRLTIPPKNLEAFQEALDKAITEAITETDTNQLGYIGLVGSNFDL